MPKAAACRWQRGTRAGPRVLAAKPRHARPRGSWRAPASSLPVSPQMYAMKSSLENMDAVELDFRMRLAEVQRQYKEKQRELLRLQRRRESE